MFLSLDGFCLWSKTRIAWGAEDRIAHISGAERLQAGIRNCQVEILAECGHVPFIEKPEETHRAISRFLAKWGEL